ncbi:MAG TPA: NAD-dependent epimerase/dehydratase family protein [Vicinamibacterales bacterium]|nr:NAD-dependent epimerase/dehydratase family protein [Vicinamibacterales bacterium]
MTLLLTGATGFVGGVLARQLIAAGHTVRAVVRTPGKARDLQTIGVDVHQGDVTEKGSMRRPMTGVDGVYHVAGWYKIGGRDKDEAVRINVDGTRHVLELAEELRVPRVVYTSTLAVNSDTHGRVVDESYRFTGRHLTVYDRTKAEAHHVAESFIARGVPVVIVQPGLIYGPGDTSSVRTTFLQFLQRKLPLVPKGTAFAWAHVEDIARAHMLAMEQGQAGRNYFICGPVHTLEEALDMAQEITGIPAPRIRVGPGVMRTMSAAMAIVENVLPLPASYTSEGLRVVAGVTYIGNNARARGELGWRPRPLRDGLVETLRHEMQLLGMSPRC